MKNTLGLSEGRRRLNSIGVLQSGQAGRMVVTSGSGAGRGRPAVIALIAWCNLSRGRFEL